MGLNKMGKHTSKEIQQKVDELIKAKQHLDKHLTETQRKLDRLEIALLKQDTDVKEYTHPTKKRVFYFEESSN